MLKQIKEKLGSWFSPKKLALGIVPLTLVLLMPELAHAAEASATEIETYQKIGIFMNIVLSALQSILWPFLVFIGDLMDADMIIGPGMEERIWAIWVQMRDLVNICFVIFLLVIAFYNTLGIGGGEGNLAMKTALPKLVIGLIAVNFTFVAGKLVIDISNVATTAVFALPELVDDFSMEEQQTDLAENLCMNGDEKYAFNSEDTPVLTRLFCEVNEDETEYTGELSAKSRQEYFVRMNKSNIAIVMAANMGGVNNVELLKTESITSLKSLLENLTFSLIMTVVFAISYVALGLVLLARVVVLWLVLAFSPLGVLIYVIPQLNDLAGGGGDIMQKIMKHLMAPIIIGVALTIGYIMIDAYDGVISGGSESITGSETNALIAENVLFSGVSDLAHLIIAVASVVVVWVGVFGAASDTIAGFATNMIKEGGELVGKQIGKLPLQAASMPLPVFNSDTGKVEKERLSILDMGAAGKNWFENARYNRVQDQDEKIGRVFGNQFRRNFTNARPDDKLTNLRQVLTSKNSQLSDSDIQSIVDEFSQIARNNNVPNQAELVRELREKANAAKSDGDFGQLSTFLNNKADEFGLDRDGKKALERLREDVLLRATYVDTPDRPEPPAGNGGAPAGAAGAGNPTPPAGNGGGTPAPGNNSTPEPNPGSGDNTPPGGNPAPAPNPGPTPGPNPPAPEGPPPPAPGEDGGTPPSPPVPPAEGDGGPRR